MFRYVRICVYDAAYCQLVSNYDEICFPVKLLRTGFPVTFIGTGYGIPSAISVLSEGGKRSLGLHRVKEIFMIQESRRAPNERGR
jgi:hypothetical protein